MKAYALIITLLFLASLTYIYVSETTSNAGIKALESKIKHHEAEADSARDRALKTKDSLDIAFTTIRYLNEQTERAKEQTRIAEKKYNSIRLIQYKTDEQRDSVLKRLYPSLR